MTSALILILCLMLPSPQAEAVTQRGYVLYLLDGSTSINSTTFNTIQTTVVEVTNDTTLTDVQLSVGVIQYSHTSRIEAPIEQLNDIVGFQSAVDNITQQLSSDTYTAAAIRRCLQVFGNATSNDGTNYPKILVLLTNGNSTDANELMTVGNEARQEGITLIAIGVQGADPEELQILVNGQAGNNANVYDIEQQRVSIGNILTGVAAAAVYDVASGAGTFGASCTGMIAPILPLLLFSAL